MTTPPAHEITWVAHRVDVEDLDDARRLGEVLGLEVLASTEYHVMLQTRRGDVIEYCAPGYDAPPYLFADQDVVLGFRVADLDAVVRDLAASGWSLLGSGGGAGPVRYQHFRGPAGRVYGLIEVSGSAPPPSAANVGQLAAGPGLDEHAATPASGQRAPQER
ncbi:MULTISPECIES: VOC family protein [Actinomycetes]|uniref:VOC family protein n=1 Tax=Actinomycetes TaxID=1760 RepID=UPI0035CAD7A9